MNLNWNYSPETLNSGRNRWVFVPCDLEIWWMTPKYDRTPLLCHFNLSASFHIHRWIQTGVTVRKLSIWVQIGIFWSLVTCDLVIWQMTLKNNRSHLLYYFTLCESFHSHQWIQTGATVLKFDGWHWKTIRHLSYVTSLYVHHFIAI